MWWITDADAPNRGTSAIKTAPAVHFKKEKDMKRMKLISGAAAAALALTALTTTAVAEDNAKPKRSLKGNMQVVYNQLPGEAASFGEMFSEGMWYGRLRMNNFEWDWKEETTKNKNNRATGIGGSVVYKTARYSGVAATLGVYYSNGGLMNKTDADDIGTVKAGKDTFSRFNVKEDDDYSMLVPAEANIDVQLGKTNIKLGDQIFESVFTKSNDTKMIPNTFRGVVVENKDISGVKLTAAYFTNQKLRDHTTMHDVITFDTDIDSTNNTKWNNNDDSAGHQGLTYKRFKDAGKEVDHTLTILSAQSKLGENLKADLSYLMLPEVLNSAVLEANYTLKAGDTKIIPGVRYYKQMDNGGGKIGGPSLKGSIITTNYKASGYTTGDSLDSSLTNVRVVIQPKGAMKYTIGYSAVEDAADIVAPWRGFPTGGYTRAMAQYNWNANTKTTMVQANADLGKAGLVDNTTLMVRYAIQDFDDKKTTTQADSNILHADIVHKLAAVEGLEFKFRTGLVTAKDDIKDTAGTTKTDVSYNEYRFEINYLF